MSHCKHQRKSEEAYSVDLETGDTTKANVYLCEWPDQNPERLVDAPRWLLKLVGSGLAINPSVDCKGCPAFMPAY